MGKLLAFGGPFGVWSCQGGEKGESKNRKISSSPNLSKPLL